MQPTFHIMPKNYKSYLQSKSELIISSLLSTTSYLQIKSRMAI
jgi:hypothetical protein